MRNFQTAPMCPQPQESVLRYMVQTEGYRLGEALDLIELAIAEWHRESSTSLKVQAGGLLVSLVGLLSGGGIPAAICLVPAAVNFLALLHSRAELRGRDKEAQLLQSYPEILHSMRAALAAGANESALIYAYDSICGSFAPEMGLCNGDSPIHALGSRLQGMAEGYRVVTTAIQTHTPDLPFGQIGSRKTALGGQMSKAIGPNTRLGALPVAAVDGDEDLIELGSLLEELEETPDDIQGEMPSDTHPKTAAELLSRLQLECPDLLLLVKSAPIRVGNPFV